MEYYVWGDWRPKKRCCDHGKKRFDFDHCPKCGHKFDRHDFDHHGGCDKFKKHDFDHDCGCRKFRKHDFDHDCGCKRPVHKSVCCDKFWW